MDCPLESDLLLNDYRMNKCRICWKEIWPKYTDKVLRCSKCRKEVDYAIEEIKEENRKLKNDAMEDMKYQTDLEDELFAWKQMYKKLRDWVKEHCNNCPYV